ncbi:transcriptional regulator, AlpA family [Gemmobacter megaterium]|uniref:Transcriptional regulator, AlpA family n=1 Tax=Gemmobacter megaterium TaxID=1086013 RepID=A0A1N7QPZ7_9RHOB|nr:AlpA family phage regulatory protein [Gemmobacter megaterium]GGE28443.1 hypothetical protein GCM10011345_38150 [Gemmobacter megaterium]SIT24854.1 transcriptional regulator, AlpA family [Gemmobacter megaterium]
MSCDDEQLDLFLNPPINSKPPTFTKSPPPERVNPTTRKKPRKKGTKAASQPAAGRKAADALAIAAQEMGGNTPSGGPLFLSVDEVAQRYGASKPTIWRWAKDAQNGFPAPVRLGSGTTRWELRDLIAFEQQRKAASRVQE